MKTLWALQKCAINDDDSVGMSVAIKNVGQDLAVLEYRPFQYDNVQCPVYDGPVIPYGGTKMIEAITNLEPKTGWTCWFNDNFRYHIEIEKFGKDMFNGDGQFMKMKDFSPSFWKENKYIFIRPDKDTKEFAGMVIQPEEFVSWYNKLKAMNYFETDSFLENTDIIVAPASRIDEEWRIFIVDNCIVGGSRYRLNRSLAIDSFVPKNVIEYVKKMIEIWQPAPVFVMDVCRVSDSLSILEIGDFHSAGWYSTDKEKVIKAVSDYALTNLSQINGENIK
jgi:hypothetical protein